MPALQAGCCQNGCVAGYDANMGSRGNLVMSETQKSARSTTGKTSKVLTDEERAAMRELVQERRRARSGKADGESDVLAKIAEMPEPDRVMAERLHAIVKASAPTLSPRTWYGMPAY